MAYSQRVQPRHRFLAKRLASGRPPRSHRLIISCGGQGPGRESHETCHVMPQLSALSSCLYHAFHVHLSPVADDQDDLPSTASWCSLKEWRSFCWFVESWVTSMGSLQAQTQGREASCSSGECVLNREWISSGAFSNWAPHAWLMFTFPRPTTNAVAHRGPESGHGWHCEIAL